MGACWPFKWLESRSSHYFANSTSLGIQKPCRSGQNRPLQEGGDPVLSSCRRGCRRTVRHLKITWRNFTKTRWKKRNFHDFLYLGAEFDASPLATSWKSWCSWSPVALLMVRQYPKLSKIFQNDIKLEQTDIHIYLHWQNGDTSMICRIHAEFIKRLHLACC